MFRLVVAAAFCVSFSSGVILPCGGRCFPMGAAIGVKGGATTTIAKGAANESEITCILFCRGKGARYTSVNYNAQQALVCQCGNTDPPFALPLQVCDQKCPDKSPCGGPGSVSTWFYNYNVCGGTSAPIQYQQPNGHQPIMGCYTDMYQKNMRTDFADNSPEKCMDHCQKEMGGKVKGIMYVALSGANGTTCICDTQPPWTPLKNGNCDNVICPGTKSPNDKESCGSGVGSAVMYVIPQTLPNMLTAGTAIRIDWQKADGKIKGIDWSKGIPSDFLKELDMFTYAPGQGPTLPPGTNTSDMQVGRRRRSNWNKYF